MDDRNDPGLENSAVNESSNIGASTVRPRTGLDVGTSKVVTARGDSTRSESAAQLNAFFVVPHSSLHETTLKNNGVPFFRDAGRIALELADCRPLAGGCIYAMYRVRHARAGSRREARS